MYNAFQAAADLTPFTHLPAGVSLDEERGQDLGAADSAKMDFREADAADEQQLNEVIWRSVRGAGNPMPPPVHAAFFSRMKRGIDLLDAFAGNGCFIIMDHEEVPVI